MPSGDDYVHVILLVLWGVCAQQRPVVRGTTSGVVARLVANDARRRAGRGVPVALADATALPFPDGTFGAVLASHVLHLIPDWQSAVDEARWTRRGGWCGGTAYCWSISAAGWPRHGTSRR